VETTEAMTNGLLQADVWLSRRGMSKPVDRLRILVFDPNFRPHPSGRGRRDETARPHSLARPPGFTRWSRF
jgi:hypothetical protein